jgi:hypothetical protein
MKGYRRNTPVLNGWHGIACEILDASLDPTDWMMSYFDDSSWETARVLDADLDPMNWKEAESPWCCLEPRRVPMLRERRVQPARIIKTAETIEEPLDVYEESDIYERLTTEQHMPIKHATIINAEELVSNNGSSKLYGTLSTGESKACSPVIVLDFGRPLFGLLELALDAPAGAVVDIFYANALIGEDVELRPVPDVMLHIGDRLITRDGHQTWQLSDTRQFRYLQIIVRGALEPVTLEKVEFVSLEYPVEPRGSFECANPVLTRVWEAGVNTLYLHMEDTHVIDATRERRQYPAVWDIGHRAIYAVYGDRLLAEELLLTTKRMQLPDGQLEKYSGSNGNVTGFPYLPYAINSFSTYQFPNGGAFYAPSVWEHYLRFGNPGLLAEHYPVLERLREFYETFALYDGLLYNLPGMCFMDWAKHELRGANLFTNIGFVMMLDTMIRIAEELGKPEIEYMALKERAGQIRGNLIKYHWNEERGLFTDSVTDGRQSEVYSILTNTYAILGGIADKTKKQRILECVFNPDDPLTRPTPLFIGSIAAVLIDAGSVDETLEMLSGKFKSMIDSIDVPTLCEAWADQAYSGASRGSIHDQPCLIMCTMHECILGVRPTAPGFTSCRIKPLLGSLKWAKGTVPTPHGDIKISCDQPDKGFIAFEIETPEDMQTELVLPRPTVQSKLTINGQTIVNGDISSGNDVCIDATTISIVLPGGYFSGQLHT